MKTAALRFVNAYGPYLEHNISSSKIYKKNKVGKNFKNIRRR